MTTNPVRRLTAVAVAALISAGTLGASPASAAAPDRGEAPRAGTTSLAEVLAADGTRLDRNWADFDIVDAAVRTVLAAKPESPVALLADGRTRLTAFIPTDAAFRALVADLTGKRPATEKRTVATLLTLADVDTIETILLYHVVPGATLTSPRVVAAAKAGDRIQTAQGGTVKVHLIKGALTLLDRDRDARNAQVVMAAVDVNRGQRQVAHGINRVLRPADL